MNPVTLPAAWAHEQPPARGTPARPVDAARSADDVCVWHLQRHCSLDPGRFGACFAGLVLVSALVAGFFWVMGAPLVTAFAGVEVLLVGLAFAWYAVHAADGERLSLQAGHLHIEHRRGLRTTHEQWPLSGLRVTLAPDGSIEVIHFRRRVRLGRNADDRQRRHVLAGLRRAMAPSTD